MGGPDDKSFWVGFKASAKSFWKAHKATGGYIAFVTLLIGVAGGYFRLVEWKVRSIVRDPNFVAEVARRIRPAMVFDSEQHIFSDTGVRALLEEMPNVEIGGAPTYQTRIAVRPKHVLTSEPILEALDEGEVSVTTRRGRDTTWEIHVSPRAILMATENFSPTNLAPPRYRLEIVAP